MSGTGDLASGKINQTRAKQLSLYLLSPIERHVVAALAVNYTHDPYTKDHNYEEG